MLLYYVSGKPRDPVWNPLEGHGFFVRTIHESDVSSTGKTLVASIRRPDGTEGAIYYFDWPHEHLVDHEPWTDPPHMGAGDPKERRALCGKESPENLTSCQDGVLCALCLIKLGRTKDLASRGALWCDRCHKVSRIEIKLTALLCAHCNAQLSSNPMSWHKTP
jgi:hypothetical protein